VASPSHHAHHTKRPTAIPLLWALLPHRHPPISPYPSAGTTDSLCHAGIYTILVRCQAQSRQAVSHARRAPISAGPMVPPHPEDHTDRGDTRGIPATGSGERVGRTAHAMVTTRALDQTACAVADTSCITTVRMLNERSLPTSPHQTSTPCTTEALDSRQQYGQAKSKLCCCG